MNLDSFIKNNDTDHVLICNQGILNKLNRKGGLNFYKIVVRKYYRHSRIITKTLYKLTKSLDNEVKIYLKEEINLTNGLINNIY
jgi:hypothetical protein